jgi:kumamolisin
MPEIPTNYQRLEASQRTTAPGARRVGPADPKEVLSVSIRVRRRPDAPGLPDATQSGAPTTRHAFLSREDFAARYGAAQEDLDRVADFARSHGLAVTESSIPRRTVVVSGTVEQMSRAFAVELSRYESPAQSYRGREGYVFVPADLVHVVEGVFGLDNRRMAQPLFRRFGGPAQIIVPLTPPQMARLYDFPPPPQDISGQTVGLLEFGGGYQLSDIQAFFQQLSLSAPTLTNVGVDGATDAPGGDADAEVALDIDVVGAVWPRARRLLSTSRHGPSRAG